MDECLPARHTHGVRVGRNGSFGTSSKIMRRSSGFRALLLMTSVAPARSCAIPQEANCSRSSSFSDTFLSRRRSGISDANSGSAVTAASDRTDQTPPFVVVNRRSRNTLGACELSDRHLQLHLYLRITLGLSRSTPVDSRETLMSEEPRGANPTQEQSKSRRYPNHAPR